MSAKSIRTPVKPAAAARRVATAPVAVPAPVVEEKKPVAAATSFDWDNLPEAAVVTYVRTRGTAAVDREATTPTFIKSRVASAYAATSKAADKKPVPFAQMMVSDDQGESFLKAGKLYATFKGYTMRGKVLAASEIAVLISKGELPAHAKSAVSYNVKDKESARNTK